MPEDVAPLDLDQIEAMLRSFAPDPLRLDDQWAALAVEQAVLAARSGNGAIGAVLVDPDGQVVERAHNQVFRPYYRSDRHAEMEVLTQYEDRRKGSGPLTGYTLVTSLEPCPMCVIRSAFAGVASVRYLAADEGGSIAQMLAGFPPMWARLAGQVSFAEADCSPALKDIALRIWLSTLRLRRVAMSQAS